MVMLRICLHLEAMSCKFPKMSRIQACRITMAWLEVSILQQVSWTGHPGIDVFTICPHIMIIMVHNAPFA